MSNKESTTNRKSTFDERLKNHPHLKLRFERILDIAEGKDKEDATADEIEEQLIIEVQKLGQETMQDWASDRVPKDIAKFKKDHPKSTNHKKKESIGIQPSDQSK